MNNFVLIPLGLVAGLGSFVGFWCMVVKGLSLVGWRRLARYAVPQAPDGALSTLGRTTLGGVSYKNAIRAAARAEGLALETMVLFRIGHPPLLIPWAAIGPVQAEKSFWTTFYTTAIDNGAGGAVRFTFTDAPLAEAMNEWLALAGPAQPAKASAGSH